MKNKPLIAIVGVGLIGGSLGQALRRSGRYRVLGIGRRPEALRKAKSLGAVDEFSVQLQDAGRACIVVLATPVSQVVPTFRKILSVLKPGTLVTDVGSVKGAILRALAPILKNRDVHFIGGHPLAGSHRTGVEAARPDLFRGATCVLCPLGQAPVTPIAALWKSTGARVIQMPAKAHDQRVALTSHLPHLLAHALVQTAAGQSHQQTLQALMAGSFRDVTRVASADPEQWADIFAANAPALRQIIGQFLKALHRLERQLSQPTLQRSLRTSQAYRQPLFDGV